jgi:iron(III) transport system ATP-binding protein
VTSTIEIDGLRFARSEGFALGPLSLSIGAGERLALVGPSGAGKTTLLRLIAGLETPVAGTIRIGGTTANDPKSRLPAHRRGIGFVFQQGALWPHMTALQHLRFCDPSTDAAAHVARLAAVGLAGKENRRPGQLSGGEGQRLSLARALCGSPRILLLDEPLHSVDVPLRDELSLLIRELANAHDLTLVVVTHDRAEALAMADRVAVLRDGRVVETGDASAVLAAPRTAYAASFLAQAACLPVTPDGHDRVLTPFGSVPNQGVRGAAALVLLPGDLRLAENGPQGVVLRSEATSLGVILFVAFAGRTVQVASERALSAGTDVGLALARPARILPEELSNER